MNDEYEEYWASDDFVLLSPSHQDDPMVQMMAGRTARDRLVERNGCGAETSAVDPDPCVAYAGCGDDPVVWCETMGMQHMRQDGFAAPAFWDFLSSL